MRNDKYQDSQVMEKDIFTEENVPQTTQQATQVKHKLTITSPLKISTVVTKLKNFKKPKLIVIVILLAAIISAMIGFLLLSTKQPQKDTKTRVKITISDPQASADPDLVQSKKEVFVFNGELESLDSELNNIKFPKIDLNVNF